MKITVTDNKTIREVQQAFNAMFPFLQVEFFSQPHDVNSGTAKSCIFDRTKTIGECRGKHNSGTLNITPYLKVSQLENEFQEKFGLSVQVFRKSGRVWLETITTDHWTLEKQNNHGEELSETREQLSSSWI